MKEVGSSTSSTPAADRALRHRDKTETGVVVLGMHRSGTSSVTGMLIASGFFAGAEADMMPANDANPRGFNENLRVYTANERILREAGATWFDPPPTPTF